MQRRAAALYGAFFLVLALGSYGMIAAASPPTISVTNPDYRLSNGDEFTIGGQTYEVAVDADEPSATISWINQSARHTTTWEAGATVVVQGLNYSVATDANTTPAQVQLTEVQALGDEVVTTTVNGTEYVVLGEGQNRTLVPRETYLRDRFGEPETRTIAVGETFDYQDNATTLTAVEESAATLAWTAPASRSVEASEGDTITLNGRAYIAHFPDAQTLLLDTDVEAYEAELAVQDTYDERINGLWGVNILSILAVVLLLGLSYLPSRY